MFAILHHQLISKNLLFSITNFLLLPIFFITTLLSYNGIHDHSTIYSFCRTYWRIHYFVSERPSLFFYSFTVIIFIFNFICLFFILNLLICEGFWTRGPTVHNTIWEGHWFTVDHC